MIEENIFQKLEDGINKTMLIKSRGYVSYLRGGTQLDLRLVYLTQVFLIFVEQNITYWGEKAPSKQFKKTQLITLPEWVVVIL